LRLPAAISLTVVGGTIAFHATVTETWLQSFYRAVVTGTPAGLDTVPPNDGARIVSIVLALCGLTIIAYAGAVIVEAIPGGVFTGVLNERRRQTQIERLHDHFIICGYGRVGRQVADEFRAAGRAVRPCRPPGLAVRRPRSDEDAEKKLTLAGADRVVMPYTAAGRTMANLVLKPQVTAFLDTVTTAAGPDLHMASIEVDTISARSEAVVD
jgi:hypothetical protein